MEKKSTSLGGFLLWAFVLVPIMVFMGSCIVCGGVFLGAVGGG